MQEAEIRRLSEIVLKLRGEIAILRGETVSQLQLELETAQELLALRNRQIFGPSSEKRPAPQASSPQEASRDKAPRKGHGPRPQPVLPVIEVQHELEEKDLACPACGGTLKPMGGQTEDSKETDLVERRFVVVKHVRKKYRCACNGAVVTAPGPAKLIPGGNYSLAFAAEVAVSKYADHLPLERQVKIMRREGLSVDSQTLWDQIEALARLLAPSCWRLDEEILRSPVLWADETRWPVLGKKGLPGSGEWWVWVKAIDDAVSYKIRPSRSQEAAKVVLQDYAGIVMADGYAAYTALARAGGRFALAHCWAHARRKFVEAQGAFPHECGEMLELIGQLYAVEREAPRPAPDAPAEESEAALAKRDALHGERSAPVLKAIERWLMANKPAALPQSGLGKAIAYTMNLWKGLTAFLHNPLIPIDNNGAERALRGVVVGRKNHYGSKSQRGTEVAALFYSLLETAKFRGVDPKAYLIRAARAAIEKPGTVTLP
jgi:transposase